MNFKLRQDWIDRMPGMNCPKNIGAEVVHQYLVTYEPGDATHYEMSLGPAFFIDGSAILGSGDCWQVSFWSPISAANRTMIVLAGDGGNLVHDPQDIIERLGCSPYTVNVAMIMIHGCLASHSLDPARKAIAHFQSAGRRGFVDPDAAEAKKQDLNLDAESDA